MAAVREIHETVEATVEEEATFWEFGMETDPYGDGNFQADTFYMVLLELEDGHLHVGFYSSESWAAEDLRDEDLVQAELEMPWSLFVRGARRALNGRSARLDPKGRFEVKNGRISFFTSCEQEYRLDRETLEGLLA